MGTVIRHPKDFWGGLLFLAAGLAAVVIGQEYEIGSARRMGPGYFPVVLGGLLALVGAAALVRGLLRSGEPVGRLYWKAIVLVLGSVVVFGLLLRGAGLAASVAALVLVAASASPRSTWTGAVLLALGMALFCALVFVKLLGLPIALLGPWLGG
jgi:hypothetical protein